MDNENEGAVQPLDDSPIGQMVEQAQHDAPEAQGEDQSSPTMIPLHVAQKLREKNRELELRAQWAEQERDRYMQSHQAPPAPKEEDNSRYESATKEDLSNFQQETLRIVEEKQWIKNNPEKYAEIGQYLPTFLKQRPNLASSISQAVNRYEEAYELMTKLSPRQQQELAKAAQPAPVKKEAPHAPGGVPKAAALSDSVDVMSMSDAEFAAWRESKRKRR